MHPSGSEAGPQDTCSGPLPPWDDLSSPRAPQSKAHREATLEPSRDTWAWVPASIPLQNCPGLFPSSIWDLQPSPAVAAQVLSRPPGLAQCHLPPRPPRPETSSVSPSTTLLKCFLKRTRFTTYSCNGHHFSRKSWHASRPCFQVTMSLRLRPGPVHPHVPQVEQSGAAWTEHKTGRAHVRAQSDRTRHPRTTGTLHPWGAAHHTCDVQLVFQALRVQRTPLLDEVEQLDGVGHPEQDVLQVWNQVGHGDASPGDGLLAAKTERPE